MPYRQPPAPDEYAPYYVRYVTLVSPGNVLGELDAQLVEATALLSTISDEKSDYRYEPEKWSIRDVVGHLIDAERVFGFRAFTFSRGDQNPLPSFEQDPYVANAAATIGSVPFKTLVEELETLRRSNILMFSRLSPDDWLRRGIASSNIISVRAIAHIMVGHVKHHLNILRERYL